MERMDTLDAEFLHLEDGIAHMHIGGVCVFADPPPSFGEVEAMIAAKLHLIPRYRQRVRSVPFELGRPVWVDDPHFNLAYHLRHTASPAPGDDASLCRLIARIMSQPLDRERPLWETWLVEGLEGGRWALVPKVHHCMVDGIAGVELLGVLLDLVADASVETPEPWEPEPEPSGAAKVLDAWGGLVTDAATVARRLPLAITHPAGTIRSAFGTITGLARFAGDLGATRRLSIEGSIGPHRCWARSSASLADVRTIRSAFGGTVNDVVLAAVAGGYRQLLLSRGGGRRQSPCPLLGACVDAARARPRQNREPSFGHSLRPSGSRCRSGRTTEVGQRADDRVEGVAHGRGGRGRNRYRQPRPANDRGLDEPDGSTRCTSSPTALDKHDHHQRARTPVPALLPRPGDDRVPPIRSHQPRNTSEHGNPFLQRPIVLRHHRRLRNSARHPSSRQGCGRRHRTTSRTSRSAKRRSK